MDEFEVELRINQLEKSYQIASNALSRARSTLQLLRSDATSFSALDGLGWFTRGSSGLLLRSASLSG